ncbi:MAG: hypothetical protein ACE5I7_13300 [Candidatus Binatia bacterium]
MGKVTIALLLTSTALLLVAFTKGINLLHGSHDVLSHLYWAMAALIGILAANFFAMFHAAQSDRIIRELRAALEARDAQGTGTPGP